MRVNNNKFVKALCLAVCLGLAACGGQKNETEHSAAALMSDASAATHSDNGATEKPARSKKSSNTENTSGVVVNINTATEEELVAALKGTGVGKAKVKSIIEYRQQNGGFKSVDELNAVKGIGDKTLEKLRNRVTVSGNSTDTQPKSASN